MILSSLDFLNVTVLVLAYPDTSWENQTFARELKDLLLKMYLNYKKAKDTLISFHPHRSNWEILNFLFLQLMAQEASFMWLFYVILCDFMGFYGILPRADDWTLLFTGRNLNCWNLWQ